MRWPHLTHRKKIMTPIHLSFILASKSGDRCGCGEVLLVTMTGGEGEVGRLKISSMLKLATNTFPHVLQAILTR